MARKKRKKNRISLKKGFFKKGKNRNFDWLGPSLLKLLKVAFIAGLFAGIGISLYYIDKKYIRPNEVGPITLKDVPLWVSPELREKIFAQAGGELFQLDENTAALVRENLRSIAWMENTSVQTMGDEIQVRARYRKPVAMIQSGQTKFYVDANQVVLDYVPIPKLCIVEIKNVSSNSQTPRYGEAWKSADVAAALKIIEKIHQRDKTRQADPSVLLKKPLISEIASIDVRNYRGVKSGSKPHIILYSLDNTPIHWGAEIGGWQKEMESSDAQKLAKLYSYYEQEGTLCSGQQINFINLRDPQVKIPLPDHQF